MGVPIRATRRQTAQTPRASYQPPDSALSRRPLLQRQPTPATDRTRRVIGRPPRTWLDDFVMDGRSPGLRAKEAAGCVVVDAKDAGDVFDVGGLVRRVEIPVSDSEATS